MKAIGRIAELERENIRLRSRISRLESRLKIEVRGAREMPFEENTPPSRVNFKKDGSWRWDRMTVSDAFGVPDERGWRTVMVLVKIPDGVDGMSFLLGSMKGSPDERLWFDSIKVYKLFP